MTPQQLLIMSKPSPSSKRSNESFVYCSPGARLRRLGDDSGARSYLEQALQINRNSNSIQADSKTRANPGLICLHLGDSQTALEYGQQAVSLPSRSTPAPLRPMP
jgi:Flp pilus assembly protein TadD